MITSINNRILARTFCAIEVGVSIERENKLNNKWAESRIRLKIRTSLLGSILIILCFIIYVSGFCYSIIEFNRFKLFN